MDLILYPLLLLVLRDLLIKFSLISSHTLKNKIIFLNKNNKISNFNLKNQGLEKRQKEFLYINPLLLYPQMVNIRIPLQIE